MIFVIEHLDKRLYAWCFLEYKHISKIVGKQNLWITNVRIAADRVKMKGFAKVFKESAADIDLGKACVLDPEAKIPLSSVDKTKFDSFVFGGILGDYPMKGRTGELLTSRMKCETRHLGPEQMSTDTAVLVSKLILDGKKLDQLKFKDNICIDLREGESVELPFRYLIEDGKPVLPEGLVGHLKRRSQF